MISNKERILDIFYKNIIPEAQVGRINCLTYYNIIFGTRLINEDKYFECLVDEEGLLVPVLMIKNKPLFDELLVKYVNKAMIFYDRNNFDEDTLDDKSYDDKERICQEKVIMALLFANAGSDDFENPINFLRKRIDFLENEIKCNSEIGYSEILKSNLFITVDKDIINNETPYQFILKCISSDGDEFIFPKVKFGISSDKVYIYAIQNDSVNEGVFGKKINRLLYKVGEGYDFGDDDLKDITHSFLVSLNVALSYFNEIGYDKIVVSPLLIERWNAKMLANFLKVKRKNLNDEDAKDLMDKQIMIQYNLTNKLVRTFLRLKYHYNNIDIVDFPYNLGSNLIMSFNDKTLECNNKLLFETGMLVRSFLLNNKRNHR